MRPKVRIIHTGGTLGMRPREPDRALAPDEFGDTVLEHVPELAELADVETHVAWHLDSTDLTHEHWMHLGRQIAAALDRVDGVVITHGTDAMAYTASALSYVLRNLPKPVILTGSQRPLADVRSDARSNLVGAVDLATRGIPEVSIYFGGRLLRGNRATKTSSFAYGAFHSPNFMPLAEVGTDVRTVASPLVPDGPFERVGSFDPRVSAVTAVPGPHLAALEALLDTETAAVLLSALGVGNIPVVDRATARAIRALVDAGKVVAIRSQAVHGRVDLTHYAGGRLAAESGAVGTADMTAEAATVKLMYLLGTHEGRADEVRGRLLAPIAGELEA